VHSNTNDSRTTKLQIAAEAQTKKKKKKKGGRNACVLPRTAASCTITIATTYRHSALEEADNASPRRQKHKRKKKGLLTKVQRDGIFCNSDQWQVLKVDSAKTL